MTAPRYDIIAIGNAIVDVLAPATDAFITANGMTVGQMRLIDAGEATDLYSKMGAGREVSGGSAANTLAGFAALGGSAAFIGQVADDQLGEVFAHDIRAQGVAFAVPARTETDVPTARCLILVSDCGQRTMNTYLGAAQYLPVGSVDAATIGAASILLLEGYLWDPAEPREAMKRAIGFARAAGAKVALGVSATFCILNHRADFLGLIERGEIDILFANDEEVAALSGEAEFEAGLAMLAAHVPLVVATRGAAGAVAVAGGERAEVAAEPVDKVVDTTGAGDLFSAGFLYGHVRGRSLAESLRIGAIAAAEVISHYGARPEADLKALVAEKMG